MAETAQVLPRIGHNSGIAAYNEFRAQLVELRELNAKTVFDYEDPKGNKDARSHVYKLRQTKAAVDKARKEEKAASLEYGRRVDSEAKEIIGEIEQMIEVHDTPLREIEQREKDRVAKHEANLSEIAGAGYQASEQWMDLPLDTMKERLAEIQAEPIDKNHWDEFALLAAQYKEKAIGQITEAIAKREKHDAEQAELERLRQEAAEREQKERDERIAREAAERAQKEAAEQRERERQEAEEKAKAERAEAERRELELKLAAERAEREKVEAEQRAANAAKEAEERLQREAEEKAQREAAEAAKREADRKHRAAINNEAVAALVEGGLTKAVAQQAVTLIAKKAIPHIQISY